MTKGQALNQEWESDPIFARSANFSEILLLMPPIHPMILPVRAYAVTALNAIYSVEIPPSPLDKGGGGSREILKRHERLPSP